MKIMSRICILFCLAYSLCILPITAQASTRIMVFGDSISAGHGMSKQQTWPSLLQTKLQQQAPKQAFNVVNLSINGETTEGGLLRLPKALKQHQPDWVILQLGANDGLRGQSLNEMRRNLQAMIDLCHAHQAKVLLAGMHIPPNYGKRYTQTFHQSYMRLSEKNNMALIPFLLEGIYEQPELVQADGLHPTAEAQKIILATAWNYLKPLLQIN